MSVEPGLTTSFQKTVGAPHTAAAFRSGDVPVLATAQALAWCEEATILTVRGHLGPDDTTLGMRVRIDHVSPAVTGSLVDVRATVARVEGRRYTFDVGVYLDGQDIAVGQIVRVLVNRDRFVSRFE